MTRRQLHHLQDALAQVGLYDLDALCLQILVQMALLGQHTLALHHFLHVVLREDVEDDSIVFVGILSPMHMDAILESVLFKLLQIVGQVRLRMFLDLAGRLAQVFPLWQSLCHAVAFLPHPKEGLIVACHYGIILQIGFSCF